MMLCLFLAATVQIYSLLSDHRHKEISELYLAFHYVAVTGDCVFPTVVRGVPAGSTLDFAEQRVIVSGSAGWPVLSVRATGALFADGSCWAAPRAAPWFLFVTFLPGQPGSDLGIAKCNLTDQAYSALLRVGDSHVVAYKLGIVKDTPYSFQVALGQWVQLDEGIRSSSATVIDSGQSLPAAQLLRQELSPFISRGREAGKLPSGVALFVAAVAYDDGRVWTQDTARESLFYNAL